MLLLYYDCFCMFSITPQHHLSVFGWGRDQSTFCRDGRKWNFLTSCNWTSNCQCLIRTWDKRTRTINVHYFKSSWDLILESYFVLWLFSIALQYHLSVFRWERDQSTFCRDGRKWNLLTSCNFPLLGLVIVSAWYGLGTNVHVQ